MPEAAVEAKNWVEYCIIDCSIKIMTALLDCFDLVLTINNITIS